jgi:AcrR family transcriptional regulator
MRSEMRVVNNAQRARLIQAAIDVVAERGFAAATVKLIVARAGVSSRTFYEVFEDMPDCFAAVLNLGLVEATRLITDAFADEDRWQDGVFIGLVSVLSHFDSEPLRARVWFVESMAAGSAALEQRERIIAALRSVIVRRWSESVPEKPDPVIVAGVMASVLGLIHSHVASRRAEPLINLLGPAMGLITAPFLDKRDVGREIERGKEAARLLGAQNIVRNSELLRESDAELPGPEPQVELARSPRRCECLLFVGVNPGASNHEIAVGIGVKHHAQISKLLADLASGQLVTKRSEGPGKRNSWQLTAHGEEVVRSMTESEDREHRGYRGGLPPAGGHRLTTS